MAASECLGRLSEAIRRSPIASDPEVRLALQALLPHSKEHLCHTARDVTEFFRSVTSNLMRLRGSANAELRLEILQHCCEHMYLTGAPSEAMRTAAFAEDLASRCSRKPTLRKFRNMLGIIANELGDRGRSIEYHLSALVLSLELRDQNGLYSAWSNLSAVLMDGGLYRESVLCASKALSIVDFLDVDAAADNRARVLTNMALAHLFLGEHSRALQYARQSVTLSAEPVSHTSAIARLVRELNLVMALAANKQMVEAGAHAEFSRRLASRFPSPRSDAIAGLIAGFVEVYLGDALQGIRNLEDISGRLRGNMPSLHIDALSILLSAYAECEQPEESLRVLRELLQEQGSLATSSFVGQFSAIGLRLDQIPSEHSDNRREYERRELELQLHIAVKEVSRSRLEMLERMAVTADIREDISGEHGYRVGRLSALLAQEIGWTKDACNAIDIAARLHDIGKIGIPEKILLDEKTLKDAEKDFIASHTNVGAEILSKSDIPQVRIAEEIARCHHEWWDGTGYPRQLCGASIPRSARIVALADAFDAMTHGRPYAKAIPIAAALDLIASLRGRQFEPELTDHFLALVRRLAAEYEDLDAYLGKAAKNSPFLKARARIKAMLAEGRESAEAARSLDAEPVLN